MGEEEAKGCSDMVERPIPYQLSQQDKNICELQEAVERLGEVIDPIVNKNSDSEGINGNTDESLSFIGNRIRDNNNNIQRCTQLLSKYIRDIEL